MLFNGKLSNTFLCEWPGQILIMMKEALVFIKFDENDPYRKICILNSSLRHQVVFCNESGFLQCCEDKVGSSLWDCKSDGHVVCNSMLQKSDCYLIYFDFILLHTKTNKKDRQKDGMHNITMYKTNSTTIIY